MLVSRREAILTALPATLLLTIVSGCSSGDGREPTYPVTGKVLLPTGKPAENAIVVFHPVGESTSAVKPRGKVRKDGSYSLTTYDGNDGAPAGEYKVTIELWLSSGNGDEGPRSRLPTRYANPLTSGISVSVGQHPTEVKTIELKK